MHHPLWNARLLKVGKAECPGRILRVDNVADTERQRLSPDDDLVADVRGYRTSLVLPPRVAHGVLIVEVVRVLAESDGARTGAGVGAVERIRRLVYEPFAKEEVVVLVKPVVFVHLQPGARGCQAIAARCEQPQVLRVLPHAKSLTQESRHVQTAQPAFFGRAATRSVGQDRARWRRHRQHRGGGIGYVKRIAGSYCEARGERARPE